MASPFRTRLPVTWLPFRRGGGGRPCWSISPPDGGNHFQPPHWQTQHFAGVIAYRWRCCRGPTYLTREGCWGGGGRVIIIIQGLNGTIAASGGRHRTLAALIAWFSAARDRCWSDYLANSRKKSEFRGKCLTCTLFNANKKNNVLSYFTWTFCCHFNSLSLS